MARAVSSTRRRGRKPATTKTTKRKTCARKVAGGARKRRARKAAAPTVPLKWRRLFDLIPGYDPIATAEPGDWFDVDAAERVVAFFHECLTHIEGRLAGRPFILGLWQQAIVGCLFGWKRADGYRRYREAFLYVPRKNGKTPFVAGVADYVLFCDPEMGQQNVCAAGEREQAALLYRYAKGMVEAEPELNSRAKIHKGLAQRCITVPGTQSVMKVISAEAETKHGGTLHLAVMDELHVQPTPDLLDVIATSMASENRPQPLLIQMTTADIERESVCNEKHDYACKVRDGVIDDATFLPVIYEALLDEDWRDEAVWGRVNPNLGVSVSLDYLRRAAKKAHEMPRFENTFRRLHLNMRTQQVDRWIPMEIWRENGPVEADPVAWRAEALERLRGKQCMGGLDLGSTSDLTALGLLFGDAEKGYEFLPWFWMPVAGIRTKKQKYGDLYRSWISKGFIEATEGDVCDYAVVRKRLNTLANTYGIQDLAVDRLFQGVQLCTDLAGDGLNVVAFGQGFYSMAAPSKRFEEVILERKFSHGNNPVLSWMAANAKVATDTAGNIKPVKPKHGSPLKIDGIVTAVMALGRRMAVKPKRKSVYETRGIRRI